MPRKPAWSAYVEKAEPWPAANGATLKQLHLPPDDGFKKGFGLYGNYWINYVSMML